LLASADDVEAQFYEALQQGDLARLMAVWADDDEIVCVHPGGARVVGAAAISASFEAIFGNGGVPAVPEQVRRLLSLGVAVHHLVERVHMPAREGRRAGPRLRAGHQRLRQHRAGLAPGGAPRQPRHGRRTGRCAGMAIDAALTPSPGRRRPARAPWLPGGNLQTIWPALFSRRPAGAPPACSANAGPRPDGDFIDVDFLDLALQASARRSRCWCCSTGWKARRPATTRKAFAGRGARAGLVDLRCRTSAAARAN
jgi:ketosteroid isomerase-like protein